MHSSTFSSDRIHTDRSWLGTWLAALLLTAVAAVSLEAAWRSIGFTPGLVSDRNLWCTQRVRVQGPAEDTLVILGASRVQLGFIPEAFTKHVPDVEVIQLALAGESPIATLRSFAEDDEFQGIILCSVAPDTLHPARWEEQADEVAYYENDWGPSKQVNRSLASEIQSRFVLVSPRLGWFNVTRDLARRKLPPVNFHVVQDDRTRIADFERRGVERQTQIRLEVLRERIESLPAPSRTEWEQAINEIKTMVTQLQARGARIVFVRYPTTGEYGALEQQWMPREQYWDLFAAGCGAPTIHYTDYEDVSAFVCVEGSHLSFDDAVLFTEFLARELTALGFYEVTDEVP